MIHLLALVALQAAAAPAVPAVIAPVSAWNPTTVGTLVTTITALITALGISARLIIKEIRAKAADGQAAGDLRDEKLHRIELLVDGRYSKVLEELAGMKTLLANRTGDPLDRAKAVIAQGAADDQAQRVVDAGGATPSNAPPPSAPIKLQPLPRKP